MYVGSLSQVFFRELGVVEQGVLPPVYVGAQRRVMGRDHSAHTTLPESANPELQSNMALEHEHYCTVGVTIGCMAQVASSPALDA